MSGQSANMSVKEVKEVLHKKEMNQQTKSNSGGTEMNANGFAGSRKIGKVGTGK
jgi:hypothetical protein